MMRIVRYETWKVCGSIRQNILSHLISSPTWIFPRMIPSTPIEIDWKMRCVTTYIKDARTAVEFLCTASHTCIPFWCYIAYPLLVWVSSVFGFRKLLALLNIAAPKRAKRIDGLSCDRLNHVRFLFSTVLSLAPSWLLASVRVSQTITCPVAHMAEKTKTGSQANWIPLESNPEVSIISPLLF